MAEKRRIWPWIVGGCGVIIVAGIAFVIFILTVVVGAMRSSDAYRQGLTRAQNDPRVQEALGTPIEPGYFVSGSVNVENDDGTADINFPIKGPKGKAKVYVEGTKTRGRWTYTSMVVTPENGPEIDLLSEESANTDPPAS